MMQTKGTDGVVSISSDVETEAERTGGDGHAGGTPGGAEGEGLGGGGEAGRGVEAEVRDAVAAWDGGVPAAVERDEGVLAPGGPAGGPQLEAALPEEQVDGRHVGREGEQRRRHLRGVAAHLVSPAAPGGGPHGARGGVRSGEQPLRPAVWVDRKGVVEGKR